MTASPTPTLPEIRTAINNAGTILYSRGGVFHFDLNAKSTNEINELKRVLTYLAQQSGAQIGEGTIHPLTRSPATLTLNLNTSTQQSGAIQAVQAGIFFSGNCYAYSVEPPNRIFLLSAQPADYLATESFASHCRRVVQNADKSWGASNTQTLLDTVKNAIALTAQQENILTMDSYVPGSLYDRDAIKAMTVTAYLKAAVLRYNDSQYEIATATVAGQQYPVTAHHLKGYGITNELAIRKNNPDLIFLDDVKAAVQADVEKYSSNPYARLEVKRPEGIGNIMESLGIRSVDTAEVTGMSFPGAAPR